MGDSQNDGSTVAVDAAHLDTEKVLQDLTKAWQQRATVGGGDAVVRASTLNLLIYSPTLELGQSVEALIPQVVKRHPSRVVHIKASPGSGEPSLEAHTQVHVTTTGQGVRQVICEQVTLDAGGGALDGLEGAVLPLIDPDLPVYLWWRGDPPFEGRLFESLVDISDYMVFDSEDFQEPDEDLQWLQGLVKSHPYEIAFSDVNWPRLSAWQALVAQFFDGADHRAYLAGVNEVRFEFVRKDAEDGRGACQAWLLLGWLASRLGWQADAPAEKRDDGSLQLTLRAGRNGGQIRAILRPVWDAVDYQGLAAVHLISQSPKTAHFRVEYLKDSQCARPDDALLIGREFESPGRDRLYEEALSACVSLMPAAAKT